MTIIGYELFIDQSDEPEFFNEYSSAYDKAEAYLEKGHQVTINHMDKWGGEIFSETL